MLTMQLLPAIPKATALLAQNKFEEANSIIQKDIIGLLQSVRDSKAEKRNNLFGTNLENTAENKRREKDIALLEDALAILEEKVDSPQSYTQTDLYAVETLVKTVLG